MERGREGKREREAQRCSLNLNAVIIELAHPLLAAVSSHLKISREVITFSDYYYVCLYIQEKYIYTCIHTGEICISTLRVLQEGYLFFSKVQKLFFHASGKHGEEVVSGNGKHRGSNPKLDGTN